ncbi:MAG: M56 family metallopeptidase [Defluviitaleaceae bacterium]|nr:M56 family metallopeptidase [Defluviitaleaceae bacterium]
MGIEFHNYVSPYSFAMGVLWFSAFILLGLLIRKLKYPVMFSVVPLLLLLVLSILRMVIMTEIPGVVVVWSETLYPAVVNFFRHEIMPPIRVAHIFIFAWGAVTVFLTAKYAHEYISKYYFLMRWSVTMPRDEHAEALLSEIIGNDKNFRIFRSKAFNTAVATAFRPHIILPEIEFSDDELRVVLLHEWKHIQDKDYLADIVINIICFVFWWNPIVYILKRNFKFATELKCDGYATPSKQDFHYLLDGLVKLGNAEKKKARSLNVYNALVSKEDELVDRLTVMAMRWESRSKRRILVSVVYSIVIVALFFASYSFTILPIARDSPYVPAPAENLMDVCREEIGEVFRMEEMDIFLVDNGDGTFSYYVDGIFTMYVDAESDLLNWVEIRAREHD